MNIVILRKGSRKPDGFITIRRGMKVESEGGGSATVGKRVIPIYGYTPHPSKPGKAIVKTPWGKELTIDARKHERIKAEVEGNKAEAKGGHGLVIKPNSEKSFRVTGNTKEHAKALGALGGKSGPYGAQQKNGDWVFSNKRRGAVDDLLAKLGGERKPAAAATESAPVKKEAPAPTKATEAPAQDEKPSAGAPAPSKTSEPPASDEGTATHQTVNVNEVRRLLEGEHATRNMRVMRFRDTRVAHVEATRDLQWPAGYSKWSDEMRKEFQAEENAHTDATLAAATKTLQKHGYEVERPENSHKLLVRKPLAEGEKASKSARQLHHMESLASAANAELERLGIPMRARAGAKRLYWSHFYMEHRKGPDGKPVWADSSYSLPATEGRDTSHLSGYLHRAGVRHPDGPVFGSAAVQNWLKTVEANANIKGYEPTKGVEKRLSAEPGKYRAAAGKLDETRKVLESIAYNRGLMGDQAVYLNTPARMAHLDRVLPARTRDAIAKEAAEAFHGDAFTDYKAGRRNIEAFIGSKVDAYLKGGQAALRYSRGDLPAHPHPDAAHPEPLKLASAMRERGRTIQERAQRGLDAGADRKTNTARRVSMAAAIDERHRSDLEYGRRLSRMAEAIENDGYKPTAFDAAMMSRRHHDLAANIKRYPSLANGDTQAHMLLRPHGKAATDKAIRAVDAYNQLLQSMGRGEDQRVPVTRENAAVLKKAWEKAKKAGATSSQKDVADHMGALLRLGVGHGVRGSEIGQRHAAWMDRTEPKMAAGQAEAERKDGSLRDKMRALVGAKIPGYFPTPGHLAARMAQDADIRPGMTVLEPSAGSGSLADAARERGGLVTVLEPNGRLRDILEAKGHTVAGRDAMEHKGQYDRIVMNPPFESGQDMAHVQRAFQENLKPGGKLVAIMGEGAFFRGDKRATAFREWLGEHGGTSEKLPDGAFKESGTGANSRLVTITKRASSAKRGAPLEKGTPMKIVIMLKGAAEKPRTKPAGFVTVGGFEEKER